jgi:CheY-like chemotaxis protein/DNA-binding CsgD family transcriptional regulator
MSVEKIPDKGIVMIIDDTPENLAVLSDTLSEAGYRVLVATDGTSALEQIGYLTPDIILLDVIMPGLNGYETCNRLKTNPLTVNVPVLFMTAMGDLDDLLKGFGEGAVDYLVKPIRPPEVLARVEAQLLQSRQVKRAEEALNHGPFAALSITSDGIMTWLPAAAQCWLAGFLQTYSVEANFATGSKLPDPIREWALVQINDSKLKSVVPFECIRSGDHFVVKLIPCINGPEYMLLLERHSAEWNLESLKNSLGLTAREAEILMWISRGKTNKEVGLIIDSSPRTINKHLEHVFEKLGVATRAAAVSVALQRTVNLTSGVDD